jgi:hypothetical protein
MICAACCADDCNIRSMMMAKTAKHNPCPSLSATPLQLSLIIYKLMRLHSGRLQEKEVLALVW